MQSPPYPVTSNISSAHPTNANARQDNSYSNLIDDNLSSRPVYTEISMVTPLQSWMTTERQSYYNKLYDSNNSASPFLLIPSSSSANSSKNDVFTPTTSFIYENTAPNPTSAPVSKEHHRSNSTPMPDSNYMACNNGKFVLPQQPVNYPPPTPPPSQLQQTHSPSLSQFSNSISCDQSFPSTTTSQALDDQLLHDQFQGTEDVSRSKTKKRGKILERNRQAALRCRQRKKEWLNQLQSSVDALTKENRALEQQSLALREEIIDLKTVLLAHRDCSHAHITAGSITFDSLLYRPPASSPQSSATL